MSNEATPDERAATVDKMYVARINARKEAKSGNPAKRAEARRAVALATEMIDRAQGRA